MAIADCPTIDDVFAAIGTEICSFLAPRNLLPLSLSNQHISKNVRGKLFLICSKQLGEASLAGVSDDEATGAAATTSVIISKTHSFAARGDVAGCLMERIRVANLRYNPLDRLDFTDTLEETLALAREAVDDESLWQDCAWCGTFRTDPAEIWKPVRKPFTVGCRFEEQLRDGRDFLCFIDWELRELGEKPECVEAKQRVFRDWARYLIAQEGVVGREWRWYCDGLDALGFMIYTHDGGEQLEIRLTQKTAESEHDTPPPLIASGFLSAFDF